MHRSLKRRISSVEKEEMRAFDDTGWRAVHLPHDYVLEGAFTNSSIIA